MEKENTIQLEDIPDLRAEMYDKISHAEALGVFTPEEADQWQSGFDACEEIEHMESLIDIIDSFIGSGADIMQRIEDLANHELINPKEGYHLVSEAETSSYQDKKRIIGELNTIIETTEKLKKNLIEILANKNIPQTEKNWLVTEFYNATAKDKEAVLNKAKAIRVPEKTTKPKIDTTKYSETITQMALVDLKAARQLLSNYKDTFDFIEYEKISRLIDNQEAKKISLAIKAA